MVQGQVFLKGGGTGTFPMIFSRSIIFTFRNYFMQDCVMHLKENYFLLPP